MDDEISEGRRQEDNQKNDESETDTATLGSPRITQILNRRLFRDARLRRHSQDREDALQTSLLRAHRGLPGLRGRSPAVIASWCETIAHNVVIDGVAKRSRLATPADDLDDRPIVAPNAQASAEYREILALVFCAAEELSQCSRQIFEILLANAEDLEPRDLGTLLAIDADAARMRRNRMRDELRVLIARRAPDLRADFQPPSSVKVASRRRAIRESRPADPYTAEA